MKAENEYWVHGLGISILVLVNIAGNPIPAGTSVASGLSAYLALVLIIALQWMGIVWSVKYSWLRFPGLEQVKTRLFLSFFLSIFWVAPLMGLADYASLTFLERAPFHFLWGKVFFYFFNAFILCFTGIGATEAVFYYARLRQSEREKEELQRTNLLTQYDSLKQQVNPHFLFNSLNSLSSLISIDPEKAERFVEEMSHVYRYLLQSNREELVALHRELDFLRSYFHLLKTRFGDALQVSVDIPEELQHYQIPPLTLQLLVENAVKHNEISTENPLRISIRVVDHLRLRVENNLQKKRVAMASEKVGLANIMAKYRLLGQPEAEVRETDRIFVVTLPLIKHS